MGQDDFTPLGRVRAGQGDSPERLESPGGLSEQERMEGMTRFGLRWVLPMDPDTVRALLSHGSLAQLDETGRLHGRLAGIQAGLESKGG